MCCSRVYPGSVRGMNLGHDTEYCYIAAISKLRIANNNYIQKYPELNISVVNW